MSLAALAATLALEAALLLMHRRRSSLAQPAGRKTRRNTVKTVAKNSC